MSLEMVGHEGLLNNIKTGAVEDSITSQSTTINSTTQEVFSSQQKNNFFNMKVSKTLCFTIQMYRLRSRKRKFTRLIETNND